MSIKKTGYTEKTVENYLMDSATVYTNVTYDDLNDTFTGTLIGATQGGPSVNLEKSYRYPEVDGTAHIQGKVKGNAILEYAIGTATVPLKELHADNLKIALNGNMVDALATEAPTGYKKITTKRYVEASDYLTNLGVFWFDATKQKPMLVILDNVLCTSSVEIGNEDNNEAVIELTFEAHSTVEQLQSDEFPWRIIRFKPVA